MPSRPSAVGDWWGNTATKTYLENKPLGTNGPLDKKWLRQNSRHMYARFNVFSVLTPFDTLTAHKIDNLIKQLLCQFEGLLVF